MAKVIQQSKVRSMLLVTAVVAAGLLTLTAASPVGAAWYGFFGPYDYPVGESPLVVTSADFDGDGKKDLATVNYGSPARSDIPTQEVIPGGVAVLLGQGDGDFQPKQEFEIASNPHPRSLSSARFNGDDFADLVVPNPTSDNVAVLLGNGDGTFQEPHNVAAGDGPLHVTCGDLDGDGNTDLAVVNTASDDVSVMLGKGDGSFQQAESVPAGDAPQSASVADFDGNGNADLVVLRKSSDTLTVLLGNGDGSFQDAKNLAVDDETYSVTSADFNGDNKDDLATAHHRSLGSTTSPPEGVSVLLGNGDGTFQNAKNFPVWGWNHSYLRYPEQVISADFNRDNKQDLATANRGGFFTGYHGASVLLGRGDGTFEEAQEYEFGISPRSLTASDFNKDASPELAVADHGLNDPNFPNDVDNVSVLMNMPVATDVTIDSGPPALINSSTATFGFSSREPGVTFECSLDGGTYEDCSSPQPYTNLSDGYHTFEVIALGPAGPNNNGYDSWGWRVDSTSPTVSNVTPTVAAKDVSPTANVEVTFSEEMNTSTLTTDTFTLTKQGSSIPVAAFVGPSPTSGTLQPSSTLEPNTTYTARVKGGTTGVKDLASNALEQDYSWSFTTAPDTTPPETTIGSGPSGYVKSTSASFAFSSSEEGSTFQCSRDGSTFSACTSPKSYPGPLSQGSHTFRVRAIDKAGNVDATPASRSWFVDSVVPKGTIAINGGNASTSSRSVTLRLSATDPSPASGVASMRFRNGGTTTWTSWFDYATSKSWTLTAGAGTKTVYVQYRDRAGNISAAASDTIKYSP